jgi:hypothetical protein
MIWKKEREDTMKDFIGKAYERMGLPQLRSFLLYGSQDYDEEVGSYSEALHKAGEAIRKRLESVYPDMAELDQAVADLNDALVAYEYVYMELGMKAGARMFYQLLANDQPPPGMAQASGGNANG